jgi:hypothetical protein
MDEDKEKRKDKPKRSGRTRIGATILVAIGCVILGIIMVNLGNSGQLKLPPPLDHTPILSVGAVLAQTLQLDVPEATPESMINEGTSVQSVAGNLAAEKPAFASSSAYSYPPFHATDGLDTIWESDGSTGSWLYVDLGETKTFHILVPSMSIEMVDGTTPETYFIASDDLKTWNIIYDYTDYDKYQPWDGPAIVLPSITARYVGLYAKNWGGGQGMVAEFILLP